MYKIIKKERIGHMIYSYEIYAPHISESAKPGQFIMLRIDDKGERIPLTISDINKKKFLIKIIFNVVGKSTFKLSLINEGEYIKDFLGPLGNPTKIKKYGTVVAIAGGVGSAEILPVIKELKKKGNKIISIIGAKTKETLILKNELEKESDKIIFTTNDGSYGIKGFVTDVLKDIINIENIDIVYTIGPIDMMKNVSKITKNINTIVSLNSLMLDGTGMCGSCRITVNKEIKFVCVDGPEFNASLINWEEISSRLKLFKKFEDMSFKVFKDELECKCQKKQK
jgi:ferredoxin--NADP+ reductase